MGVETDPHRLEQRQKQIDYGKNTEGYQRYIKCVPKKRRRYHVDPVTPDKTKACSKRQFDGLIRVWRRKLHDWDPPLTEGSIAVDASASSKARAGGGSGGAGSKGGNEVAPQADEGLKQATLEPKPQQKFSSAMYDGGHDLEVDSHGAAAASGQLPAGGHADQREGGDAMKGDDEEQQLSDDDLL
ncbi:unnamed protein product [Chrysoparadoxa australica]